MESINYLPLLIIFIIAWVVPLILSWLEITKVPSVIVEIIIGVLVGPFVLNIMGNAPYLQFLADTGFLFLIFLAGLEIDIGKIAASLPRGKIKLKNLVSNSFLLALFIYFGSLFLSIPFIWLLKQFVEINLIFYALIMPTVALSITVPILKADGELNRKFGQILLLEGAIATVMSIIMVSIYSGIWKYGFQFELLLFLIIFMVFILVYLIGQKVVKMQTFQKLQYRLEHAASQIRVRGTVALLLVFVIVANLINTEEILGAFFAGAVLSLFVNKQRSSLLFKLDGMSYGFFIPIFFIMVGVQLDLSALSQFSQSIPFVLILTFGFFLTQMLPALALVKIFGWKKAMAGGALLTARLGLTIATAQIGLSLGVITSADNAALVIAAIFSSLISPFLYKVFSKQQDDEHYNIYLLGGCYSSLYLAERLKMHGLPCLVIIQNPVFIEHFKSKSLDYQYVDKIDEYFLNKLKLRTADLVIVLTELPELNLKLAEYIVNNLNHSKIITFKTKDTSTSLNSEGIKLLDQDEIIANYVEDLIVRPDSVASLTTSFDNYRIEEIRVSNPAVHRKFVKEVALPPSGSLVILRRNGEIFIPHGTTHLLMGDIIIVIGNSSALSEFRKIFEDNR